MNTEKLVSEIKRKQSFLCVGLDVDLTKIPAHLLTEEDDNQVSDTFFLLNQNSSPNTFYSFEDS